MMGDCSPKQVEVGLLVGHGVGGAIGLGDEFGLGEGLLVTQGGVADARELVGQGAGGFVVVGSVLQGQCPGA